MQINKKIVLGSTIIVSIAIILSILSHKNHLDLNEITYNKNTSFSASYIIPKELKHLEEKSTLIVKGKFTDERQRDEDETLIGPSTISQFEINKSYKGNSKESIISVLEPFQIENNDFINIDGYIPMQKNQEYILFLRDNDTPHGKQYTIISINFGKYNISDSSKITPIQDKAKYLKDVSDKEYITQSKEECDIYNAIKENIINKYK